MGAGGAPSRKGNVMAVFTAHTTAWNGNTLHHFKPGDEVPEWANVGAHVTTEEAPEVEPVENDVPEKAPKPARKTAKQEPAPMEFTKPPRARKARK